MTKVGTGLARGATRPMAVRSTERWSCAPEIAA